MIVELDDCLAITDHEETPAVSGTTLQPLGIGIVSTGDEHAFAHLKW
ncbi:MAG TPA: hypothetical protein VF221_20520 [Chloroflexota bacterium]